MKKMFKLPQPVMEQVTYVAYVDKGLKFFKTRREAEDAGKFITKEVINKEEVTEYKRLMRDYISNAYNAWLVDLKNECVYLTASGTFNDAWTFIAENCIICHINYEELKK